MAKKKNSRIIGYDEQIQSKTWNKEETDAGKEIVNRKSLSSLKLLTDAFVSSMNFSNIDFLKKASEMVFGLQDKDTKGLLVVEVNSKFKVKNWSKFTKKSVEGIEFTYEELRNGFQYGDKEPREVYEFYAKDLSSTIGIESRRDLDRIDSLSGVMYLCVPIVYDDTLVAMILLITKGYQKMAPYRKEMIRISAQMIENYYALKNYPHELELLKETIRALSHALELKDTYTRGHSDRVSTISLEIANALNMSSKDKEDIRIAALLHDIGKIGVSDEILVKRGSLSTEEYEKIKEHPIKTLEILNKIDLFKDKVSHIASMHHERYDGKGYPYGKRHSETPVGARIIQVADSYDAMTSNRAYREKKSQKYAIDELIKHKGSQFDPDIVDVFNTISHKFPIVDIE